MVFVIHTKYINPEMYMGVSLNSFVYLKFGNPLPGLSADPTTKIARHGQGGSAKTPLSSKKLATRSPSNEGGSASPDRGIFPNFR